MPRTCRAVFLDRDGVINEMHLDPEHGTIDSPTNPDQFKLLPGANDGIKMLNEIGFIVIVVSNQPGVAKGKLTNNLLKEITAKMVSELAKEGAHVDAVLYCLHHPEAILEEYRVECECRKPKAGLLLQASERYAIDLKSSFMIGDGITDIETGKAAGCRTIWLGQWKCEHCELIDGRDCNPDFVSSNLLEAAGLIKSLGV